RGYFTNFTGTAGVWRRAAIEDSGGWSARTLTEDLDLSYRAQLRGWRAVYLEDLVVPEELPVSIDAYRRQQSRWATGSFQAAFSLLMPVMRSGGQCVRTPKYQIVHRGQEWRDQAYVRAGDPRAFGEALLGVAAFITLGIAITGREALIAVYSGVFALGFLILASMTAIEFLE